MFDCELGITLHPMQGIRASSATKSNVSCDFSFCGRILGYIDELQRGWPFETRVCSTTEGLLSSYDSHLRNINSAWQDNTNTSGGEVGDHASLSSFHRDIGIGINFQEESGLGTL